MTKRPLPFVHEIQHLEQPRNIQAVHLGEGSTLIHTTVGKMDNNCWFIVAPNQNALLIDAADDAEHLLSVADSADVRITDVLTTHQHFDHVQALEEVLRITGAVHHAGRYDAEALPAHVDEIYGNDEGQLENLRLSGDFSGMELPTVELRGHTPGGIAVIALNPHFFEPPRAFVGDSLFPGGVGKTNNKRDFEQLLSDVSTRILSLPGHTLVHPGHGDSTRVEVEAPKLEQWRERGW
ncbi:MBL fold metallo-hydrolase [Corynebacterium sp. 4HC-13]|uniref:MBL fold metallo-hydrolase n=1 Tax=Corynebacterium anserum TaxID=2684406 RepID=UPI00163B5675|nr:MBL fold metallo-hydrolase [Corynebacterium anserum]MBC2680834.1 MBL fold metallo-hydrolase [Corynebacterium anserum]